MGTTAMGSGPTANAASSKYIKSRRTMPELKKKQEISYLLKYLVFAINFLFWGCGCACIGVGTYAYIAEFRPIRELLDFLLNPAILLIIAGGLIFLIAFLGCGGALRENVCMLKFFGLALFVTYILLVVSAFVLFLLFYSDTDTGISIYSIMGNAVKRYHENDNLRNVVDLLQSQLHCCGATSQGYKDWNMNEMYSCAPNNTHRPEFCGVPHSCCVIHEGEQMSSRCGLNKAQRKSTPELADKIYTDGCLTVLRQAFEGHAVIIGAVIGAVIVPVCLSITFSNILWKQVERQRWRLERQRRRDERWQRRLRRKIREQLPSSSSSPPPLHNVHSSDNGLLPQGGASSGPSPPPVQTSPVEQQPDMRRVTGRSRMPPGASTPADRDPFVPPLPPRNPPPNAPRSKRYSMAPPPVVSGAPPRSRTLSAEDLTVLPARAAAKQRRDRAQDEAELMPLRGRRTRKPRPDSAPLDDDQPGPSPPEDRRGQRRGRRRPDPSAPGPRKSSAPPYVTGASSPTQPQQRSKRPRSPQKRSSTSSAASNKPETIISARDIAANPSVLEQGPREGERRRTRRSIPSDTVFLENEQPPRSSKGGKPSKRHSIATSSSQDQSSSQPHSSVSMSPPPSPIIEEPPSSPELERKSSK